MFKKILFPVLLFASLTTYSQTYTDVIASTGLPASGGQIHDVIDYNNDGWEDVLYQNGASGNLKLYKNTNGVFTDVTAASGLSGIAFTANSGVLSFDYNNDGFQDILITTSGAGQKMYLYKNNCGISFVDMTLPSGMPNNVEILGNPKTGDPYFFISDFDKDNDNDILFPNKSLGVYTISALINNGGVFTLNPSLITGFTSGISPFMALIDYDDDRDDDIVFIRSSNVDHAFTIDLYENGGTGLYGVVSSTGITSSSPIGFATVGDFDGDGYADILLGTKEVVLPGSSNSGNKVFLNNAGDGTFSDVTSLVSTYSSANPGDNCAAYVFDADNDGDLDILWQVEKTGSANTAPDFMFNNGTPVWPNRAAVVTPGLTHSNGQQSRYTIFDYNHDGVLDIFRYGAASPATNAVLLKGTLSNSNNYLTVNLLSCNAAGDPRGTKVIVNAGGKNQVRTYSSQQLNTASINAGEKLHFGLGSATNIDTLTILFPNANVVQQLNVPVNQDLTVTDGSCSIGLPLVFDLGADTTNVCNQDTAYLLAPGSFASYVWSNGDATPDTKTANTGWIYCTATNAAGCFLTDSTYVIFGKANIIQNDTDICWGASVTLSATPRYDCSPFGAPNNVVVTEGQNLGPNFDYIGKYNGHFYYRILTASSWNTAAQNAQLVGGFLATINDIGEQTFIETNPHLVGVNLWLGLYKNPSDADFRWSNCDTFVFNNWAPSMPIADPNMGFVVMENDACADARNWKNVLNDNSASGNTCDNINYGLVEIDPGTNITYSWSNGASGPTTVVSPLTSTSFFVQIKQNGVTCFDNVNINVINANDLLPADSLVECKASYAILSANPGMTSYHWSTGSNAQTAVAFANGWYKVSAVSPQGCTGLDSMYVTIFNASIKTPDTSVCLGTPVTLRGPTPPYAFGIAYTQNFQTPPFLPDFNYNGTITFNGSKALGPFSNDSITLNLSGLANHDSVEVTFDLYIHDTWEGESTVVGKDKFRFKNGLANLINASFSNNALFTQSYPSAGSPAKTGATAVGLPLRCSINGGTTLYTITKKFKHTLPDLALSWVGDLFDTVDNTNKCDESWSIDNVKISLRKAGDVLWSTSETTQDITVNPTLPSQDYWIRVPAGTGYCYDTVAVSTFTGKIPYDILANDTDFYCNYPPYLLYAPDGYSIYSWSSGVAGLAPNYDTVYNTGWYNLNVTTQFGGCIGNDSVFVQNGKFKVLGNDTSVCYGNGITLSADLRNGCSPFGAPANTGYIAGMPIPGYTYKGEYHGHHYYLSDVSSNWTIAAQSALAQGGFLACINDTLEQNFIASVVDSNAWLGLYRTSAGYHKWMNCDTLLYTNWGPGEPSASPEDYVFMERFDCATAKAWNSYLDDDISSPDPCLSGIYGLMEIEPFYYKFVWTPGGDTTQSIFVNPLTSSSYSVKVQYNQRPADGSGCNGTPINVNVINEFFDVLPDSAVKLNCNGDTVMLEAKAGFTNYTWNNGETVQIATYHDYVGWAYCSYNNGVCTFKDSVYVNVPAAFKSAPIFTDITCYGLNDGIATANATGGSAPFIVTWLHDGSSIPTITNLSPGKYIYTITDSMNCFQRDTVTITNPDSALTVTIQTLKGVSCNNDTNAILFAWSYGGELPYTGNWIGYSSIDTLKNIGAGIYTYSITDNRGCSITKDIAITDPDPIKLTTTIINQIVCSNDSTGIIELNAIGGTKPFHYIWNGINQTSNSFANVFGGNLMTYVVDTNGCTDSVSISMVGSNPEKCGLIIPQGFTPNGDGKNDFFYIKGIIDYPENELTIFNRWGETVYHKVNYANDWDGKPSKATLLTSGDGIVPNDTYYYVLKTFANNKTYSGYVYLTK